ncbi:hypothetical protein VOLCADRAFT_93917 [Volvox carteri f. nagariensis]|uniref:PAS domain-containing protein n=1 Tax=Volvox carteri f. nagariensis TaxID=3068 RepID=D8U3E9_VOLCA|nr:uncharacterized protein VOLCADRAFT_93917 [Volvox carteri f. nagariensis]EFJ45814.1 hypothetical protein VOLCADRAFT_93917 [Volvox carteri f. nagariensis]|eukprot:XP_002953215.1 hypothetical protein VOLCADRAFT_93917 [Volvox carteri f. nagariensis]
MGTNARFSLRCVGSLCGCRGYNVYIRVFYAIVGMVYTAVGCIALLTYAMRKQEHSRTLMRFARVLQLVTEVVFTLAYMSVFDYMLFLFKCEFSSHGAHPHAYFKHVECSETPHLIHMTVAGVTAVVFFCSTGLMLVAGCDLSPVGRGVMASPAAVTRLKVLMLKALYVIVINTMASVPKPQAVAVLAAAAAITFFNFTRLPFLRTYINYFWVGGWTAVSYTCGVYCYFMFHKDRRTQHVQHEMVKLVLYGVFPAAAAGTAATVLWLRYCMYPTRKFVNLEPLVKLKKVHQFASPEDVEVVARSMRRFDIDGIVLEETALVGETIIKCGMAVFPGHVGLLILYANFLMEVKRDGPAARTQLQLALKAGPSLVQRYQIFSTIENSKRLKDGQEGQLDLQSYVEAVIRMHKAALTRQREFWQLLQRSSVRVSAIEAHVREMDETADTAHQVYKRVLERYPHNGKLLRCYGKFLEDVRNDPVAAARVYTEAARNGGGDGLLSLDLQITGSDKPEFLASMDLHDDACIVINAEGKILMVNACVTPLLGYPKTELEGANVSIIMPQPFSGRHPSYLSRYVQGGEPHILDTVRDVVALHKERHVFPLQICVTKLSGVGTDAIFLGLLRPQPLDSRNMRAWVAPNGVILCTDPQFSSLTGLLGEEMVGRNIQTLCTDMAAVEALLELCKEAPYEALGDEHLPPVLVEIKVAPGGTDSQRIFVFNARRIDGIADGLMVVDTRGTLSFATWDVAAMLGYPLKKFLKMKLDQLLPQPFASMHTKYLRDHPIIIPPTSCRAGRLVQLVNSNGAQVPVRLQVTGQDDSMTGKTNYIVQVRKMDTSSPAMFADRRLVLLCTTDGQILSVDHPESTLFGFSASACVGSHLADCIDVFSEWRTKAGTHQMELLLLSMLDREMEMPGTSWRVKVHSPETTEERLLPSIDPRSPSRHLVGRSACLQTELVDAAEYSDLSADVVGTLTKIILWRRDLLTGVVELDHRLVIRKADVSTGLIVGLPPTTLLRTPLHSWEELMLHDKHKKKKSAMKGGGAGSVVSVQRAFEGAHPDGGTMKVFMQGVNGGGTSRIHVTLHPDTTFQGARANIYRALGLEALMQQQHQQQHQAKAAATTTMATTTTDAKASVQDTGRSGRGDSNRAAAAAAAASTQRDVGSAAGAAASGGPSAAEVLGGGGIRGAAALSGGGGGGEQRGSPSQVAKRVGGGGGPGGPGGSPGAASGAANGNEPRNEEVKDKGTAAIPNADGEEVSSSSHDDDGEEEEEKRQRQREGEGEAEGEWPVRDGASWDQRSEERPDREASVSSGGEGSLREGGGCGGEDEDDEGNGDPGHLHKIAHNQSEFVAQWVRTLAKQMSSQIQNDPAADRDVIPLSRQATLSLSGGGAAASGPGAAAAVLRRRTNDGLPPPPGRRTSNAGGSSVAGAVSMDGGGAGGAGRPSSTNANLNGSNGLHWALMDRGSTMMRSSRRKLDLDPVNEDEDEEGKGEGEGEPGGESEDNIDGASSQGDDDDGASQGRSSGAGGAFTDASSAMDVDLAADARRARLLKRLCKLFGGPQLTGPLLRMRVHTWLLLAAMLATHVVMYVILIGIIDRQFANVREVHRLALAADRGQLATIKAAAAEFCSRPGVAPVSVCEAPLTSTLSDLRAALDDLESYHQGTYLGSGSLPRKIKEPTAYYLWTSATGTYKAYFDTQPPTWVNETAGVWQLGNRFIATAREILYYGLKAGGQIADHRAFKFVIANGPWAVFAGYTAGLDYLVSYAWGEVEKVQRALIIMLAVEAAGVQLACIVYELVLLRTVEQVRSGGLLTSLAIPGPMLRVLASRPIVVVEDSDDEDGEEDDAAADGSMDMAVPPPGAVLLGGAMPYDYSNATHHLSNQDVDPSLRFGPSGVVLPSSETHRPDSGISAGFGPTITNGRSGGDGMPTGGRRGFSAGGGGSSTGVVRSSRGGRLHVNGKELVPSYRNTIKFMIPLLLWEVALIALGAVSFIQLNGMQGPLASLNMASHVIYRYTRVRMTAFLLVTSGPGTSQMAFYRNVLQTELVNLQSEYDTLMYGGLSITQAGSVFQKAVPASTFESSSFAGNFFTEERCFRWDQSKCYTPDSPYYEVTHHGLDVMLRRIISEMTLLASDDDLDTVYNSTRYNTMYMIGTKDLYEGLQSSAQLFVDFSISRYNSIKVLQTILLAITVVFFLSYALLLLRPYTASVEREAMRLAGLLSHVPAEMDVTSHVRQVLRAHLRHVLQRKSRRATAGFGARGLEAGGVGYLGPNSRVLPLDPSGGGGGGDGVRRPGSGSSFLMATGKNSQTYVLTELDHEAAQFHVQRGSQPPAADMAHQSRMYHVLGVLGVLLYALGGPGPLLPLLAILG